MREEEDTDSTERHGWEWIGEGQSKEDIEKRYDRWAESYDRDMVGHRKYWLQAFTGDLFIKYVKNRDARILDAGAGTGLSGEYISGKGYHNLYGIDISGEMLDEARRKEVYHRLDRMVLGETLDFSDNYFDAVLGVGAIGTAPAESFDELIRVTKSSGLIVFRLTTDYYDLPRFRRKILSLEETGKWKLVEKTDPIVGLPGESLDTYQYGFVYQVL